MSILIEPADLAARLDAERAGDADTRTVVLDVRWTLAKPDGSDEYREGHIPGAVYVDLDAELADHDVEGEGRHPLPSEAAFTRAIRRWGLHDGDTVVVADGGGSYAAARAWWLLEHAGWADVRILDGALPAWSEAGLPLEQGDVVPEPGDATARFGSLPVVGLDGAAGLGASPADVLLDARAGARYRGEVEPIDPRAGHIPGAVSAPTTDNIGPDGRFLPADALRERFAGLGVDGARTVGSYCGSGITAAHQIVALRLAGFDGVLYPGSFSQWSNRFELPVATGAEPDGERADAAAHA